MLEEIKPYLTGIERYLKEKLPEVKEGGYFSIVLCISKMPLTQ